MSSNSVRIGGWAAVISILGFIFVLVSSGGDFENPSSGEIAALMVASIATMLIFYAFYNLFRGDSSMPALMLGLGVVGVGLTMIPSESAVTYNAGSVVWGVALILVGILMQRAGMSRWLAWLSHLVGVLFAALGIAGLAGAQSAADTLNIASAIPAFAWMVWVAWVLLTHRQALAS